MTEASDREVIWAHSGDSHFLEPKDLWRQILPPSQADRMPRSERVGDDEIIQVDGQSFRRRMPKIFTKKGADGLTISELSFRPPGSRDANARLGDLDQEGVWGEVVYASLGLWSSMIKDPELVREASRAENEWIASEIQGADPNRLVPAAQLSLLSVEDAVTELEHARAVGLHAANLPTGVPARVDDYHRDTWDPLWSAAEETGMVLCFHIGTDGNDQASAYSGPGGAVMNYVETTFSGQRVALKLVTSGALDRHPRLKVLISEGGASWVPFLGDRMNEGYRQHGMFVRPKLSRSPKEILYDQIYTSFQHDASAIGAMTSECYQNLMWSSDYPHLEGTFGHTQETLHELFDPVDEAIRYRITQGAFLDLFPHVGPVPASVS